MNTGRLVADRFEIDLLAGSGGMGSVYRAWDRSSGSYVAFKLLHGKAGSERFAREAELLSGLKHPGVVRYVGSGVTAEGEPYLAMEWLAGETLSARIERGPLGIDEALEAGRLIAAALAVAHDHGIVHRDLKPGNIFLVGGALDRIKLLDFGIARPEATRQELTETGAMLGTPAYMAPEQAKAAREVDARADVYALGVVLFRALTGCRPFEGETVLEVLLRVLVETAPRLSTLRADAPAALDDLVARMLSKEPADRPRDGREVADVLRAIAEARSPSPSVDAAPRAPEWRRGSSCPGEELLADVVRGTAPREAMAELDEHLDGCATCRETLARCAADGTAAPAPAGTHIAGATAPERATPGSARGVTGGSPTTGGSVDRYQLLEVIGRGVMGEVYAAIDPELDRKVALKFMRHTHDRARFLREAQAMARLTHPNVVPVFDFGIAGADAYIVMERVQGTTLRGHLAARPRPPRDILRAFADAGRGLSAAHEAGVVHRDFKPDNVLVADDGRVLVTDFGLAAWAVDEHAAGAGESDTPPASLTHPGSRLGTPAYMSPEQHRGEPADARSDQWGFCVSLYEALYGERPVEGDDPEALAAAVRAGRIRSPVPLPGVPRAVRRALARGLAPDREARFPDMSSLLRALAPRRRTALWIGGGVGLVAAATALGLGLWLGRATSAATQAVPADRCEAGAALVAEVWGAPAQARVHQAFAAGTQPAAEERFQRFAAALSRYADDWAEMHREACRATFVSGTQSDALLDARMSCLERHRRELGALVTLYEGELDDTLVANAVDAAVALSPLATCADAATLAQSPPLPDDPGLRTRIAALEAVVAEAQALESGGEHERARALLEPEAAHLEELYYLPIAATFTFTLAVILSRGPRLAEGRALLERAYVLAETARDDRLRQRIAARAVLLTEGVDEASYHDALGWATRAEAALARLRDDDGSLRGSTLSVIGHAHFVASRGEEARRYFERALAALGETPSETSAATHFYFGVLEFEEGHASAALAQARAAVSVREALGEADFPAAIDARQLCGRALFRMGDPAGARDEYRDALRRADRVRGPDDPRTADLLDDLATAAFASGHEDEAEATWKRQLALAQSHGLPTGRLLLGRALLVYARRDVPLAESLFGQAALALDAEPGNEPAQLVAHRNHGASLFELERFTEAVAEFERALSLAAQIPNLDPLQRAETESEAAIALASSDPARARTLALQAREHAGGDSPQAAAYRDFVDRFLAKLGPGKR